MPQPPEILAALRKAIENYHASMRWNAATQQHRDPFISWHQTSFGHGPKSDLQLRVLLILINARFDQGTLAERALENTQRVVKADILDREDITLSEVPQLKTRQRVKVDRWRELFWRSLPGLKELSREIAGSES